MATYYVFSGAAGANNGTSWTDAFTTLAGAVAAATVPGDEILVHKTHTETSGGALTYTFLNRVAVIVVDKDAGNALAVMDGTTGCITGTVVATAGAYPVFIRGLAMKGTTFGGAAVVAIGISDGSQHILENCLLWSSATGSSGMISIGYDQALRNAYVKLKNCTIKNASSLFPVKVYAQFEMEGGTFDFIAGTSVFSAVGNAVDGILVDGVDFSSSATTLVGDMLALAKTFKFSNCKLNASTTVMATQTIQNLSSAEVYLYNCASSSIHYAFGHYNALGSTTISSAIYANDNPTYDGTNKCSWMVSSTANASFYSPYVSPWINKYHDGTSAITPYLECLRNGSATAYQDNQVWAEFSYQGTSGFPLSTQVSDRMALLGTPANQTASAKGASDWTGENATAWFGKLDSGAAITPAAIGHLRARVCVGVASSTVYVDPQIRT